MATLTTIRQRLVQNRFIYRVATSLGLAMRMKRESESAAARGEKLDFKWSMVRWEKGGEVILFPPLELALINYFLHQMRFFHPRLIFSVVGDRKVADLRRPTKYRLPSGSSLWLPMPAEPVDFFSGYFAKGSPKLGDVVLDAGAYCGETTLEMAARVGPKGHVFAFEPDPKNLFWLRKNVQESGLKNITIVPKGLWGQTTTLKFISDEAPGSTLVGSNDDEPENAKFTRIDVLSPADAFALIGRIPDFVKMDIEGAEVEVVDAMASLLGQTRVSLAIASYHLRGGRKTHEMISPILKGAGLNVETGYEEHLTTWAWRD
jgi:FkbM family methyltransferase